MQIQQMITPSQANYLDITYGGELVVQRRYRESQTDGKLELAGTHSGPESRTAEKQISMRRGDR